MAVEQLHTVEELNQFIDQGGKRLLFKHSSRCPISAKAHEEFLAYVKETNIPAAEILVIEDRPVSNQAAEVFGIRHESPQIFLLENGKVQWNEDHAAITKAAIEKAVQS
ncbi:bacillithiol system redox-active protein YtxJ [Heyndrickxia acidiproducens]|uniref:bacillithiol system redox-active protein YtxJ n=1 Tax=Heyndrickxia acidiproducens TaxID=1121084 RepID=UPI00036BB124|nr:bacillithiol system redox-active protein YtxJ [Heyndrickxia acidiproducens]